ncbi:MAG: response regulator transcription factor [Clostridia bacterium]
MPRRILAVDDDSNVLEIIRLYLEREGHEVLTATTGELALRLWKRESPDLVILDVMMPGTDGWDVCRRIRADEGTPVMFLSGRDDDQDRILGLELGADDYITKPFNPRELVARVKVILRRTSGEISGPEVVSYPGLELNRSDYSVITDRGKVDMTPRELEVLWLLASNPNRVFSRDLILQRVWGYDYLIDTRTVDTHIKRIRKKLGDAPDGSWRIGTVWGVGYRFELGK